jgi:hypothetical protein
MNPPTITLAPRGIMATASSMETARMIETPVDQFHKGEEMFTGTVGASLICINAFG